jgi:drug/metabolite transporter (DMT)-like permease
MNRNMARLIITTAGLLWGLGFIGNKFILDNGWSDSQLLFVRFLTATIVIFAIFFQRIMKADRYVIKSGLFLGVFLYLGFFFQTWGLDNTTASNNALITSGYIIMMPIIVYLFERRRVGYQTVIAGFITMLGISLITVDFQELTIAFGDTLTFVGALFYAFHIYFLGKQTKKVDLVVLMAFQLLMFSFLATIMMIVRGGMPSGIFANWDSIGLLFLAMGLGFFGSFVAFMFQSIGQKYTNESEAAILIATESVFGPVFAILFYNDPFNLFLLFGIILVFIGIVLSEIDIDDLKTRRVKNDS